MIAWDQSTFLAKRVQDAQVLGPPQPPTHIALPGAKRAIPHERLLAYQDAGLTEHAIRDRTNARWRQDNAAQLDAHDAWTAGPYRDAIVEAHRREMERVAEDARRRALLEQMMTEWQGEG